MDKNLKSKNKKDSYVVSFRVGAELYEKITQYAQNEQDDAGIALKPPAAARRLVLKALGQLGQKSLKKRK